VTEYFVQQRHVEVLTMFQELFMTVLNPVQLRVVVAYLLSHVRLAIKTIVKIIGPDSAVVVKKSHAAVIV
jgi:hypothetical protein